MNMQERVIGAWRLLRWSRINADAPSFEPFGATPVGRLMYQPGGLMAGFLMRPDWPEQPVDTAPLARWLIAYSGKYVWDIDVVSHHVDISSDPRWIGAVLQRAATFDKELLVLETVDNDPAAPSQRLTWARD